MRIKLCDKYNNEREEICKKLIDILKLDMNNSFLLSDLDDDVEMQTEILNMKDEIQKCFACSNISSFIKHWCNENGIKYEINVFKLGVKLINMKLHGVSKGRHTKKGETKIFNITELKKTLKIGCIIDL